MSSVVQKKYALLQPKVVPARTELLQVITHVSDPRELEWIALEHPAGEPLAVDFETRGNEPANRSHGPVGVAFADSRGSCYIDFQTCPGAYEHLFRLLHRHRTPCIAHNVPFDAAWPLRDFSIYLNWVICTLAVYRTTSNEGFFGQQWGQKAAQIDMLGWESKGDVALDKWLIENDYVKNVSKKPKGGYYFYPEWPVQKRREPRWVAPEKGEMWRAPPEILGHYACLDADSCWLLWTEILKPCVDRFTFLREYIYEWYPTYLELHVRQKLRGIRINKLGVEEYLQEVVAEYARLQQEFYTLPEVATFLSQKNAEAVAKEAAAEPHKWNKVKERKEPERLTKSGAVSKNWLKWKEWTESDESKPKLNQNWLKWRTRMDEVERENHFNLGSAPQVRELLYTHLGLPVEILTKPSKASPEGLPSTGKTALLSMGEVGQKLLAIKEREKVRQFCEQLLSLLVEHEDGTWTVHPGFMVPGTLTGRLSGKSPNVQQIVKDGNFLRHWLPILPDGVFVDNDHASIEPVVLTELSKCPGLLKVYGKDAKPNCIYLYTGSLFPNEIGDSIRKVGYRQDGAETKEELDRWKEEAHKPRKPSKRTYLAWSYGASAGKLQVGFKMDGYLFGFESVQKIKGAIDAGFPGVASWTKEVERQWKKNGGWVFSGLGEPLCVDREKIKDIKNRIVQRTAHSIHIKYILIIKELLDKERIEWYPTIIDFHDESIIECRKADAPRVAEIIGKEAYVHLNAWLDGDIPLSGGADIVPNLAYAKIEDWEEDEEEEDIVFVDARANQ